MQKKVLSVKHFDGETLTELRQSARVYQKLDLAYFVAAGSIVTALNINQSQIFEIAAEFKWPIYGIVILLGADTYVEQTIFSDWMADKTGAKQRQSQSKISFLLTVQPILHLIFLGMLVVAFLAYSGGVTRAREEFRGLAAVQAVTDLYIAERREIPDSIASLIALSPWLEDVVKKMPGNQFRFEADARYGYTVTYAGRDNLFGTRDDKKFQAHVKLREVLNEREANSLEKAK